MPNRLVARHAVILFALIPAAARAQVSRDTVHLPELVVTATRVPVSPNAVTASVTRITGEDLAARGVRFVLDALREVPGATVVPTGSFGGVTSLFLRGGQSNYVKVLVDGVPVNRAGGAFDWSSLTTNNLDRIEVVRGPASVIYGSDAVSGVVQIFTRRGQGRPTIDTRAEVGTFGTVNWDGGVSGGSQRIAYSADVSRFTTDGTYAFNNRYRNSVGSGSLRLHAAERTDVTLSARYSDNAYHFPTDFLGVPVDSNQMTADKDAVVSAELGQRLGSRMELRVSAGGSRAETNDDDRPDNAADTLGYGFASRSHAVARRGNVEARMNAFVTPFLTLTSGAQIERETEARRGETTSNFGAVETTPNTPFDSARTTAAFYGQAILDLARGFALNVNGRVDHNSAFGTFVTYRAGAAYRFPTGTRIRASVGRAFKAPTFCEQFCNEPFIVGNAALTPERTLSWEAGAEQPLLGRRLTLFVTYFDQRFRNLVIYDGAAALGAPNYRNAGAATARGLETGLTATLLGGLSARASYSYLDSRATEDGGQASPFFTVGAPLLRRPMHSAQLALGYHALERITLGAAVRYVGRRDDVRTDGATFVSTLESLPAYATVDLAATVDVTRSAPRRPGLSVSVRAENLFDRDYETVAGYRGRGRALYAGGQFHY